MESIESGNNKGSSNLDENTKKYLMSLLFIQTKELQKTYVQQLVSSPMNYRLVDKEWLDNYKQNYNYKSAIDMLNSYNDYSDYDDFKQKISSSYHVSKLEDDDKDDIQYDFESKKEKLDKYELEYNREGELICEECFQDLFKESRDIPKRDVLIGDKTILINDEQDDKLIYSYSLVEGPQNNNNFFIQVNSVIILKTNKNIFDLYGEIGDCKGLNKYLEKKNIDPFKNEEQKIYSKNGENIGIFLNLQKSPVQQNFQNMNFQMSMN